MSHFNSGVVGDISHRKIIKNHNFVVNIRYIGNMFTFLVGFHIFYVQDYTSINFLKNRTNISYGCI